MSGFVYMYLHPSSILDLSYIMALLILLGLLFFFFLFNWLVLRIEKRCVFFHPKYLSVCCTFSKEVTLPISSPLTQHHSNSNGRGLPHITQDLLVNVMHWIA